MTVDEQLNEISEALLQSVDLDPYRIKVPSHSQPLNVKPFDHPGTWNCDKVHGASRCLSGLTGFHQSAGIPGYDDRANNFDMCEKCVRADLFI